MSGVRGVRLQNLLYHLLLVVVIGMLSWLTQEHRWVLDVSADRRNSLDPASVQAVQNLDGELVLEAFLGPAAAPRQAVRELVGRYQRYKPDLRLELVDPRAEPARARELGIRGNGELILRYRGRDERLQRVDETTITNALRRLARSSEQWLGFVQGHGERNPTGDANHDLGRFGARLQARGLRPAILNLVATPRLPDNLAALILAGPDTAYLPGEMAVIHNYLDTGGNLALLLEPGASAPLQPLLEVLGVGVAPGTVVDAGAARFSIDDPSFAVVTEYPGEAMTGALDSVTLFPQAAALLDNGTGEWTAWPILRTGEQSWNETGVLQGEIRPEVAAGERLGPQTLGYALTRNRGDAQQRVLVVGDGDFLSNAFLGNGANLELGLALLEWLVGGAADAALESHRARDLDVELPETALLTLALASLLGVPACSLLVGVVVWRRRRR